MYLGTPVLGAQPYCHRGVVSGRLGCRDEGSRCVMGAGVMVETDDRRRRVASATARRTPRARPGIGLPRSGHGRLGPPRGSRAGAGPGGARRGGAGRPAPHGMGSCWRWCCGLATSWWCATASLSLCCGSADWRSSPGGCRSEWLGLPILESYLPAPDHDVERLSVGAAAVDGVGPCHLARPSLDGDQRLIRVDPCDGAGHPGVGGADRLCWLRDRGRVPRISPSRAGNARGGWAWP